MDTALPSSWSVLLAFALVALNGFFVAVEFALVRSQPLKFRSPDMKGKLGVQTSLKLMERLDFSLSATQLGITVASLLLGWWGESTFSQLIYTALHHLGVPLPVVASHTMATTLALILVTFLHVVLGELAAKSIAIVYPETTLRYLAGPTLVFAVACRPAIYMLTACSNFILRLFGIRTETETQRTHSLAELSMLVTHSGEKGVLDKVEEEMLQSVFSFSETVAREVMTPRTDLIAVSVTASLEELVQAAVSSGFSRLPVIGESIDDIQGIIMVRDLLPYVHNLRHSNEREFNIRRIMREPYFVPGTKSIADLLNEFKRRKIHIAVVLDEHGGVDGVVTLEDVIEEIVGDIFDESDIPERDIIVEDNGNVIVDGGVLVADINSRLDFDIPEGDYDTIAGFIYTSLGRLPRTGDEIVIRKSGDLEVNGLIEPSPGSGGSSSDAEAPEREPAAAVAQITVERVTGRRIDRVKLQRLAAFASAEPDLRGEASQDKGSEIQGK